jgi:hypothetical protein
MPAILTASNASNAVGKWNPYYFKPFLLGECDDSGAGSTDGVEYITQTVGSSDEIVKGTCNSSFNCGFYYTLTFTDSSGSRFFYVTKYDLNDNSVDIIHASEIGTGDDGRWWKPSTNRSYTIDVGVNIHFTYLNFNSSDVYKISLPSADTMDRRKIYHGGYSSFLRMPETEGKAYHSDIIPTNLNGKNITVLFNPNNGLNTAGTALNQGLDLSISREDVVGQMAVSLALEWNTNKDSATNDSAGSVTFGWGPGETWQLGSLFINDTNPQDDEDFPSITSFPSSDVSAGQSTTGTLQVLNVQVSGRAGYARMKTEYYTGAGQSKIAAFNQYWPIILMIS